MKRLIREMLHDITEARTHIWIVLLAMIGFVVQTFILQMIVDDMSKINLITLQLLEIIIPSLGGYAALMLMQGLLDTEGGEIAFSYSRSYLYWGCIRQLRFFMLFSIAVSAVCYFVTRIMRIDYEPILWMTLAQCFAVMGISFLAISMTKKVSVALVVLFAFVSIQILIGREFERLNLIYLVNGAAPSFDGISLVTSNSILIGICGWWIGQLWLRP